MKEVIKLSKEDIELAYHVADRRRQLAQEYNRKPKNGCPESGSDMWGERLGALAELAGKHYLDPIEWKGLVFQRDVKNLPDLSDWIDVKGIANPTYSLIILHDDKPEWAYCLVDATRHPFYKVRGWAFGKDVMRSKYLRNPQNRPFPSFFVPQGVLNPPQTLWDLVRKKQDDIKQTS